MLYRSLSSSLWMVVVLLSLTCSCSGFGQGSPDGVDDDGPQLNATIPDQMVIFSAGEYGYACFRIPVLLVVPGAILAFVEARSGSCSDYHAHSILVKRSIDSGRTWSDPILVSNVTRSQTLSVGDGLNLGAAVFQPGNETQQHHVWITWVECFHRCQIPHQFVQTSPDYGKTWAPPREITSSIMALSKFSPGPGYGIYLPKTQRLLFCGHYLRYVEESEHQTGNGQRREGSEGLRRDTQSHSPETPDDVSASGAACIYSDDLGATWCTGVPVPYNSSYMSPDECQPAITSNYGGLLMTMRDEHNSHHPLWTTSYDGGETWDDAIVQTNLTAATCDASLLSVNLTGEANSLFFSHPDSAERERMTVHFSKDDRGAKWSLVAELWAGPAAYSCMAYLPPSSVGVLYENGDRSAYEKITFAKIDWI